MAEQTFILLPGSVFDTQDNTFAAASYARTVTRLTLIATGTAPTDAAGLQIKLQVNGVDGATYTLPQNESSKKFSVTVELAAEAVLKAIVVAAGGANEVAVWIQSIATIEDDDDNWVTPTAGDIQSGMASQEYNAFTDALLQTGQDDPVPQILIHCRELIRDAIRSGARCNLGTAGTIPRGAKLALIALAKSFMFERVASISTWSDKARPAKEKADLFIKGITDGETKFIEPTTVGEYVPSGAYGYTDPLVVDSNETTEATHVGESEVE